MDAESHNLLEELQAGDRIAVVCNQERFEGNVAWPEVFRRFDGEYRIRLDFRYHDGEADWVSLPVDQIESIFDLRNGVKK